MCKNLPTLIGPLRYWCPATWDDQRGVGYMGTWTTAPDSKGREPSKRRYLVCSSNRESVTPDSPVMFRFMCTYDDLTKGVRVAPTNAIWVSQSVRWSCLWVYGRLRSFDEDGSPWCMTGRSSEFFSILAFMTVIRLYFFNHVFWTFRTGYPFCSYCTLLGCCLSFLRGEETRPKRQVGQTSDKDKKRLVTHQGGDLGPL